MPSYPLVVTCVIVALTGQLGVTTVGDPLLSLSAIGARPPVVVVTMRWLILAEFAKNRRLKGRVEKVVVMLVLFSMMVIRALGNSEVRNLPSSVSACGARLEGPSTMRPLVVSVVVSGTSVRPIGQPYGETTLIMLSGRQWILAAVG